MPNSKHSDEEQWRSDESDDDDRSGSDEEYDRDDRYDSESDGEEYSDNGSGEGSDGSYSDDDRYGDEEMSNNRRYAVNERFADDEDAETKGNDNWWEGREKLIAAILLCWCCLCLIIIGVVLGVVLGGKDKVEGNPEPEILPAPTERPTFAPQPLPPSAFTPSPTESLNPTLAITRSPTIKPTFRPTIAPTESFAPTKSIPETIGLIADQDTYTQYNISKEFQGEEYGLMDTFLVQRVPLKDEELADSVALISFPLKDVPVFSRLQSFEKSAVLRLTHVVSTDERPPANYTIVRIPETRTKMEYWHGFYFVPPEDDDEGVLVGPEFEVYPSDTVIDIDVSSLFFNYTLIENRKPKKVFFMIENRGPEQVEGGDRFYTRESSTPPQLTLNFKDIGTEDEP